MTIVQLYQDFNEWNGLIAINTGTAIGYKDKEEYTWGRFYKLDSLFKLEFIT